MAEWAVRSGVDVVEIARIEGLLERHERAGERMFTGRELEYCRARHRANDHLAARFAAKEAVFKLLGASRDEGMDPHDIEIVNGETGRPAVVLRGAALKAAERAGITGIDISLSHDGGIAIAQAVALSVASRTQR